MKFNCDTKTIKIDPIYIISKKIQREIDNEVVAQITGESYRSLTTIEMLSDAVYGHKIIDVSGVRIGEYSITYDETQTATKEENEDFVKYQLLMNAI